MLDRRQLITGLVSFAAAAPAIMPVTSIMPVRLLDILDASQITWEASSGTMRWVDGTVVVLLGL